MQPIDPSTGAVVRDLDVRSPAARAGIKAGDVIREVDRRPIRSIADFNAVTRTLRARTPVLMRVQRGDTVLYIVVTTRE